MLRLRDIMTTELVTLDPDLTIREAMDVFTSKRVSGAPVVSGDDVLGVVSTTDLLEFAASLPGLPTDDELAARLLGDTEEAQTEEAQEEGAPPQSADDDTAARYFAEPWDETDDTQSLGVRRGPLPVTAEWNALDEHTVAEAMTRAPLHALPPDTFVPAAADYLRRNRIHRVLVMAGRKLFGIVTTSDIADAVADGKLTSRTYVFERSGPQHVRDTSERRR